MQKPCCKGMHEKNIRQVIKKKFLYSHAGFQSQQKKIIQRMKTRVFGLASKYYAFTCSITNQR